MKVIVSILNWNSPELSKQCIDLVLQHTNFESAELWLTDNGSFTGETVDVLKTYEKYPFVKTVFHPQNIGALEAQNYVFNRTDSEYYVTLGNDVEVCPNWLDIMLQEMVEKDLVQLGVWIPGVSFSKLDRNGGGYCVTSKEDPDYIDGFCMIVNRKAALSVGPTLFSEYLKIAYYEDSDLSLRFRAANYKIGFIELPMVHHVGHTTKRKDLNKKVDMHGSSMRNREIFRSKWCGFLSSFYIKDKILVKRYGGIGDVLWTTPILRALKKAYPAKTIDFLTSGTCGQILGGNPFVNKIASDFSSIKESDYEEVIDFNLGYENNPTTLLVEAYADIAKVPLDTYRPEYVPDVQQGESAGKKMGDLIDKPYVVLHVEPAFLWAGRSLPMDRAQLIVDYLGNLKIPVVEIGGTGKAALSGLALDMKGELSLAETAEVIKNSKLFIGAYSGPAVMAMAMNTPAILLFGSISPEYKIPKQITNVVTLTNSDLNCLGCHHYKMHAAGSKGMVYCLRSDVKEKCMVEFPMDGIYASIDSLLNV